MICSNCDFLTMIDNFVCGKNIFIQHFEGDLINWNGINQCSIYSTWIDGFWITAKIIVLLIRKRKMLVHYIYDLMSEATKRVELFIFLFIVMNLLFRVKSLKIPQPPFNIWIYSATRKVEKQIWPCVNVDFGVKIILTYWRFQWKQPFKGTFS